jgi:hypothetical protein
VCGYDEIPKYQQNYSGAAQATLVDLLVIFAINQWQYGLSKNDLNIQK